MNHSWSVDFVADGLVGGRKLRCLTIVDRECLAIEVDTSIKGRRVAAVLDRLGNPLGLPLSITIDHAPKGEGQVLDACSYEHQVQLSFIRRGEPLENAYIVSFNGRFRDERLNEHWFLTVAHARRVIGSWRMEYNTERPHSSLGDLTPEKFAMKTNPNLLPPLVLPHAILLPSASSEVLPEPSHLPFCFQFWWQTATRQGSSAAGSQ